GRRTGSLPASRATGKHDAMSAANVGKPACEPPIVRSGIESHGPADHKERRFPSGEASVACTAGSHPHPPARNRKRSALPPHRRIRSGTAEPFRRESRPAAIAPLETLSSVSNEIVTAPPTGTESKALRASATQTHP